MLKQIRLLIISALELIEIIKFYEPAKSRVSGACISPFFCPPLYISIRFSSLCIGKMAATLSHSGKVGKKANNATDRQPDMKNRRAGHERRLSGNLF